jgi:hypothetical protein
MSLSNLEVSGLQWRKARRSANNGACVEVAPAIGQILIRDSRDPEGPLLSYSIVAFRSFLDSTKKDAFPR